MLRGILRTERMRLVSSPAPSHNVPGWKVTPWMTQVYPKYLQMRHARPESVSKHGCADNAIVRDILNARMLPVRSTKMPIKARQLSNGSSTTRDIVSDYYTQAVYDESNNLRTSRRLIASGKRRILSNASRSGRESAQGNGTHRSTTLRLPNGVPSARLWATFVRTANRSFPSSGLRKTTLRHLPRVAVTRCRTSSRRVSTVTCGSTPRMSLALSNPSYYLTRGLLISPRGVC